MNLRGRIERLETRRVNDTDVTLGEIVAASYLADSDPRLLDLEERFSRSRLVALIVQSSGAGSVAALVGPGEASLH